MDKKYFSRKFLIALLITGVTVYFGGTGVLDGDNIMILLGIVGGGYGFANVIEQKNTKA